MDSLALLAALCVTSAGVVLLVGLHSATANPRGNVQRRLGAILRASGPIDIPMLEHEALRSTRTGRTPIISSLLQGRAWTQTMAHRLERADIRLTVSEFVALRVFVGLGLACIPLFILGTELLGIFAIGVSLFAGWQLPGLWVGFAQGRRLSKLNGQLPETLIMLSSSLKAGFGLMQAMDLASRQLQHPIATELRRTMYDVNVGASTEEALTNLAQRAGSEDLDIVITAMLIQQSTGGNLAEILDNVAHTLRERIRIRGEIKTLTSQQRLTGLIIGGLPFVMVFLFTLINPDYMRPLYTEAAGIGMIVGGAVLELIGVLLIKKILAIEV